MLDKRAQFGYKGNRARGSIWGCICSLRYRYGFVCYVLSWEETTMTFHKTFGVPMFALCLIVFVLAGNGVGAQVILPFPFPFGISDDSRIPTPEDCTPLAILNPLSDLTALRYGDALRLNGDKWLAGNETLGDLELVSLGGGSADDEIKGRLAIEYGVPAILSLAAI